MIAPIGKPQQTFMVTTAAERPAGRKGECFYCNAKVGDAHQSNCVLIMRRFKMRAVIEFDADEPAKWTRDDVEFHRNEGSWCQSIFIEELEHMDESGCLCGRIKFECLGPDGEAFLREE